MPRPPRIHAPGGFHHVTLRGNHRCPIFGCEGDRTVLDQIVGEAAAGLDAEVHAYCWMTNHLHLVVREGDDPLGRFMHRLATRYARYFQRKLETTGHLFERRYHSVLVRTDAQVLAAVRYVHLNPVVAGLVTVAAEYRWSSHRKYVGVASVEWLRTDFVLALFGSDPDRARLAYAAFIDDETAPVAADPPRSPEPARLLGPPATRAQTTCLQAPKSPRDQRLEELVASICREERVAADDLASPSRARRLAHARARIFRAATLQGLATPSQLARRFNRHVTSLCKSVSRRESLK